MLKPSPLQNLISLSSWKAYCPGWAACHLPSSLLFHLSVAQFMGKP